MKSSVIKHPVGQSAIEYLILATTITIVVLVGLGGNAGFLTKARQSSEVFFKQTLRGVMGSSTNTANILRKQATNYP